MAKWNVVLSTTEPYNYVGMINVRQGNRNTEVMEAAIVENGRPYDLTGCKVYFESIVGEKFPVQLDAKIVDAKNGKIQYTFDQYSMQSLHGQTADFMIMKGTDVIGTTQDFSYFVVKAVSKTEGEMGSYWQSVEDLIADMAAFINENQGDFTDWMNARKNEFEKWREYQQTTFEAWRKGQETDYLTWFESIKDILRSVDPGGVMLSELMDARVDINGVRHDSITKRLKADAEYLYTKLRETLYTLPYGHIEVVEILQDDAFSTNHEVEFIKDVQSTISEGALVIATVDDPKQNVFKLVEVGEIK
ncbi:phage baseplate upper protein [Enterococcus durans]|uniref:phage baseplate upper protein n=1 Tax=Enterococcus durans TaxID=53345 RepID=UPI0039A466B9